MCILVKLIKIFCYSLLSILVIGSGIIFWMADPFFLKDPKDQYMIDVFNEKKTYFERVSQLVLSSQIDGYETASDLSHPEKEEYKRLISKISPGISVYKQFSFNINSTKSIGLVLFEFAGGGLSTIGPEWGKGIEYISGDPKNEGKIVTSLDNLSSLPAGNIYLKKIAPQWFIYFMNLD